MYDTVDVRCPNGPQRLFTRLKLGQETARMVQPGNLLEFSCSDCAKKLTRAAGKQARVYHLFNFIGDLVSTRAEYPDTTAG